MIYIVGHKNPDTDTVCAGIALAELKNNLGVGAQGVMQGEPGPETQFVLNKFGVQLPEVISDATGKEIFLVDHSDLSQTVDNLDTSLLKGIVDHHKLGDITTPNPVEIWSWPVGSTCTVIKRMFDFYNIKPDKNTAGIMLGSVLSDTVIFKSSTCTDTDKKVAEELAEIAGVENIEQSGYEMFKAKSEIEGASAKDLLSRDYKDFDMSGKKVGIGQLEMVDINMVSDMKEELIEEMEKLQKDGRHSVILLLTDIMKEGSELLVVSEDESVVEKAFHVKPQDKKAWLPEVMSRKKQVVPNLEDAFAEL